MKKTFLLLFLVATYSLFFFSCNPKNDEITSFENELIAHWYSTKDNYINAITFLKDGTAEVVSYSYINKEWQADTSSLAYTVLEDSITLKEKGGSVLSGKFTIAENTLSINNGNTVYAFSKFDGSESKIEALKADIEKNWQDSGSSDVVTPDNIFQTEVDYKTVISVIYSQLLSFEYNQLNLENIRLNGKNLKGYNRTITASSSEVYYTWLAAYKTINYANLIIKNATNNYVIYKNEALALRAFVYYNVAMLWDVTPYVDETTNDSYSNINYLSASEVYRKLTTSLNSLKQLNESSGRFGSNAVKALLGEIALTQGSTSSTLASLTSNSLIFALNIDASSEYASYGTSIPVYSANVISLLKEEANATAENLIAGWKAMGDSNYGYWAMLKRIGKAKTTAGCQDYELLMPYPTSVIESEPQLTQNPGY